MKTTSKIGVQKLLRYTFLALTVGFSLLLLLELSAYFGISSSGPFLRGYVMAYGDYGPDVQPLTDSGGVYKIFHFGERKLMLLNFDSVASLFKVRHLFYLFCQNMAWVSIIFVMFYMHRIFKNLDTQTAFLEENTRHIRMIALNVLIYPFVNLEAELQFKAIVSRLPGHKLQLSHIPIFSEKLLIGILLCLVILALAEVFRYGTQLQQEQDLTI